MRWFCCGMILFPYRISCSISPWRRPGRDCRHAWRWCHNRPWLLLRHRCRNLSRNSRSPRLRVLPPQRLLYLSTERSAVLPCFAEHKSPALVWSPRTRCRQHKPTPRQDAPVPCDHFRHRWMSVSPCCLSFVWTPQKLSVGRSTLSSLWPCRQKDSFTLACSIGVLECLRVVGIVYDVAFLKSVAIIGGLAHGDVAGEQGAELLYLTLIAVLVCRLVINDKPWFAFQQQGPYPLQADALVYEHVALAVGREEFGTWGIAQHLVRKRFGVTI